MKSIGSMIVLLLIESLVNPAWSVEQTTVAHSNQVATSKSPVFIEVEVRMIELSQEALSQFGADWMVD